MFPALASLIALRRRALASGSPPPERAATVISLINFVNSLPRLASSAPFLCLILCHLECPDIGFDPSENVLRVVRLRKYIAQRRKDAKENHDSLCTFARPTLAARILSWLARARADPGPRLSTTQRNPDMTCGRRRRRHSKPRRVRGPGAQAHGLVRKY